LYEEAEITEKMILGPLDLEATLMSGQTSEPQWDHDGNYYFDVEDFNGGAARYGVRQTGTREEPHLRITITSEDGSTSLVEDVTSHIVRVLRLDDDLNEFYRAVDASKADIVTRTVAPLKGLRLMRANNLFEALICSISTQHNSIVLWTKSMKLIREMYGSPKRLSDG